MINEIRGGYPNVIVVDAGNFLFSGIRLSSTSEEEDKVAADYVALGMTKIGYDIANVGPNDLAGGLDFLKEIEEKSTFTFISSNILYSSDFSFVFEPYIVKEVGGVKVGFLGVMGGGVSGAHDIDTFVIMGPIGSGKKSVEKLTGNCDLIVALFAGDRKDALEFARGVPGIDLIITTGIPHPIPVPQQEGDVVLISGDKKGKRVGRITITLGGSRPYDFDGEIVPIGSLVTRDSILKEVENEYYKWSKENDPGTALEPLEEEEGYSEEGK